MTEIHDLWRKGKSQQVKKKKTPDEVVESDEGNKVNSEKAKNTVKGRMIGEFNTKAGGKTEAFIKEIIGNLAQEDEKEEPTDVENEEENTLLDVNEEEDLIAEEFLQKFLIGSESAFLD